MGWSPFARHYSGNNLFSSGYLDVSVPPLAFISLFYSTDDTWAFPQVGFPIRASPDITPADGSPKLIAANRALHRLLAPRHPPCALSSLVRMIFRQKLIYTFCSVFKVLTPAICCWLPPSTLVENVSQKPITPIRHKSGPAYRSGRPRPLDITYVPAI